MKRYIVFYKGEINLNVTHYQNESRRIRSKCFDALEEAKAFAETVNLDSVHDRFTCKYISL